MTTWWNKFAKQRFNDFKVWTGDYNQPSKSYVRNYIIKNNYQSVIDCGCGLAEDYFGFQNSNYSINYTGIDNCKLFVEINQSKNINIIEADLEKDLPVPDNSYDCSYCREVLEHLSSYKKTLSELIRISKKEVIIIFFIKPGIEKINYSEDENIYHNKYSLKEISSYLKNNSKIKKFFWKNINDFGYSKIESQNDIKLDDFTIDTVSVSKNISVPKSILHIILNN